MVKLPTFSHWIVAPVLIAIACLVANTGKFQTAFLALSAAFSMVLVYRALCATKKLRAAVFCATASVFSSAMIIPLLHKVELAGYYLSFSVEAHFALWGATLVFAFSCFTKKQPVRKPSLLVGVVFYIFSTGLLLNGFQERSYRSKYPVLALPVKLENRQVLSQIYSNSFLFRDGFETSSFQLATLRGEGHVDFGSPFSNPTIVQITRLENMVYEITYEDRISNYVCGNSLLEFNLVPDVIHTPLKTKRIKFCDGPDDHCKDLSADVEKLFPESKVGERVRKIEGEQSTRRETRSSGSFRGHDIERRARIMTRQLDRFRRDKMSEVLKKPVNPDQVVF